MSFTRFVLGVIWWQRVGVVVNRIQYNHLAAGCRGLPQNDGNERVNCVVYIYTYYIFNIGYYQRSFLAVFKLEASYCVAV